MLFWHCQKVSIQSISIGQQSLLLPFRCYPPHCIFTQFIYRRYTSIRCVTHNMCVCVCLCVICNAMRCDVLCCALCCAISMKLKSGEVTRTYDNRLCAYSHSMHTYTTLALESIFVYAQYIYLIVIDEILVALYQSIECVINLCVCVNVGDSITSKIHDTHRFDYARA